MKRTKMNRKGTSALSSQNLTLLALTHSKSTYGARSKRSIRFSCISMLKFTRAQMMWAVTLMVSLPLFTRVESGFKTTGFADASFWN